MFKFFVITDSNNGDMQFLALFDIYPKIDHQEHFIYNTLLVKGRRNPQQIIIKLESIKYKCVFLHSEKFSRFSGQAVYVVSKLLSHVANPVQIYGWTMDKRYMLCQNCWVMWIIHFRYMVETWTRDICCIDKTCF